MKPVLTLDCMRQCGSSVASVLESQLLSSIGSVKKQLSGILSSKRVALFSLCLLQPIITRGELYAMGHVLYRVQKMPNAVMCRHNALDPQSLPTSNIRSFFQYPPTVLTDPYRGKNGKEDNICMASEFPVPRRIRWSELMYAYRR